MSQYDAEWLAYTTQRLLEGHRLSPVAFFRRLSNQFSLQQGLYSPMKEKKRHTARVTIISPLGTLLIPFRAIKQRPQLSTAAAAPPTPPVIDSMLFFTFAHRSSQDRTFPGGFGFNSNQIERKVRGSNAPLAPRAQQVDDCHPSLTIRQEEEMTDTCPVCTDTRFSSAAFSSCVFFFFLKKKSFMGFSARQWLLLCWVPGRHGS